ncbi:MAG: hypothetical protein GX638_12490 [Crenarchaeota archaeon]|nr:hypothetical protein [Thermoproteota archaeon]
MVCSRCGCLLDEGEGYDYNGKILCEDCYMYLTNPPKTCDPMAVASALSSRKKLGQSGTEGLTELQKKIYNIIAQKGKVTMQELIALTGLKAEEMEAQFAILRHCELVKGQKEGSIVYLTTW